MTRAPLRRNVAFARLTMTPPRRFLAIALSTTVWAMPSITKLQANPDRASSIKEIEDAVEAGIETAAKWVSEGNESFLVGNRAWSSKEFQIAERSAREAIAALRQFEVARP